MKIRAMVYSANHYFVDCLNNYVMESANKDFEFSFFSEETAAVNFLKSHRVDVLLADELFLQENEVSADIVRLEISNRTRVDIQGTRHELNIYQRGVDILGDLQKVMLALSGKGRPGGSGTSKIISFYSPQGGSGKTTLIYICALLCARNGTSVYLNLEEFGHTDHLYQTSFQTGMEEVLFAIKDKRDVAACISNSLQKDARNVSVMPTMKNYSDLTALTAEDIDLLLKALQQVSGADFVFVDISGSLTPQNRKVLELSDYSFWVFDDTDVGRGKMERIRNDQSVQGAEYFDRSYFLINKCRTKSEDAYAIRIPWSESLSQGADVETVLSGNKDFYTNCKEIVTIIGR